MRRNSLAKRLRGRTLSAGVYVISAKAKAALDE
jgi:hypothetical protein